MNIREVAIRDAITAGEVQLGHIPGAINQSDIFTKEHKEANTKYHHMHTREKIDAAIEADAAGMDKEHLNQMSDAYGYEEDNAYLKKLPKLDGQSPTNIRK